MILCHTTRMVVFLNDTATTESYTNLHTLSLHDALPIFAKQKSRLPPSSARAPAPCRQAGGGVQARLRPRRAIAVKAATGAARPATGARHDARSHALPHSRHRGRRRAARRLAHRASARPAAALRPSIGRQHV